MKYGLTSTDLGLSLTTLYESWMRTIEYLKLVLSRVNPLFSLFRDDFEFDGNKSSGLVPRKYSEIVLKSAERETLLSWRVPYCTLMVSCMV